MTADQKERINSFLLRHDASLETLSKGRIKQLKKVDDIIQEKLKRISEAKNCLQTSAINISTISAESGISRKTFYNNELLKKYVESYTSDEEKVASAKELEAAKLRIEELEKQVHDMVDRDIETGKLWHENEVLNKEIRNLKTQLSSFKAKYEETHLELVRLQREQRSNNVISFPKSSDAGGPAPVPIKKRTGTDPNTFNIGISYGSTLDFLGALNVSAACGTHTLMVYCDNEYFDTPAPSALKGFRLVIHGPLNANLASPDPRIRVSSVKRLLAIIKKCNSISQYISAFIVHPGSAEDDGFLIESMKELLKAARFKIAVETMAGRGNELCTTLEQLNHLTEALSPYNNFSICVDTCHMSDAGYSLENADAFLSKLTEAVPVSRISCVHVNDSCNPTGSHKDRHAVIGTGTIPVKSLARIATYEYFYDIPKILESPQDSDAEHLTFKEEIHKLLTA